MELVNVATAPNQPIAEMWCDMLRKEGIPAFPKLPGAGGPTLDGAAALEGCWVMVREDDVDRAMAILRPMIEGKRPRHRRRRK